MLRPKNLIPRHVVEYDLTSLSLSLLSRGCYSPIYFRLRLKGKNE